MAQQGSVPALAGLLEQPSSWLHQLVISLPESDRRALFQTCMQLAMQVLTSAPNVMLRLAFQAHASPHSIRRRVIAQLLATRRSFGLVLLDHEPQPFPHELASQVTEVRLKYRLAGPGRGSSCLDWSAFVRLESFRLPCFTTQAGLDKLCTDLEAGHLPKLRHLRWDEWTSYDSERSVGLDCGRFARALGPRLTSLYTGAREHLNHLNHLTSLYSIETAHSALPYSRREFKQLLEHPTLRVIKLWWLHRVQDDHSNCSCRWHSLHLIHLPNPHVLLKLPLTHLQELHIHGYMHMSSAADSEALRFVIDSLADKVNLVPAHCHGELCFEVMGLTVDTIPIVNALKCDSWLILSRYYYWEQHCSAFLPALWAALHPSVSSIRMKGFNSVYLPTLWDGIPHTVKHIELWSPDFCPVAGECSPGETLRSLFARTPGHVSSLKLSGLTPGVQAAYEIADVYKVAPKHLKLELTCS